MRLCGVICCLILLLSGSVVSAETAPPSHNCIPPLIQRSFITQGELDRYKSLVDKYRICLEAFVKEQEAIIGIHRQAALQAIDEWDKFVGQNAKTPRKTPEDKGDDQGFRDLR
jgi:hypothetical protein